MQFFTQQTLAQLNIPQMAPEEMAVLLLLPFSVVSLFLWCLRNSMGKTALAQSPDRNNNMPIYIPVLIAAIWLLYSLVFTGYGEILAETLSDSQQIFIKYLSIAAVELAMIVMIIFAARKYFAQGLKGFGLDFRTIAKDFAFAVLNFLTAWPVVIMMLFVVMKIGQLLVGDNFGIPKNESLDVIIEYKSFWLRYLIVIFAGVIVPIFEEFLFRGLLQTAFRTLYFGKWQSILITAIIFSALHPSLHFPALFVLAIFLGYSYEKSGSLLRPIFIHIFFNTITVTLTLLIHS